MALVILTPYTRSREAGAQIITTEDRVEACKAANLEHWIACGYVNVTVDDYTPTQAFGDRRTAR